MSKEPTIQELKERINELTEALDSHGACHCELCIARYKEREDLRQLLKDKTRLRTPIGKS